MHLGPALVYRVVKLLDDLLLLRYDLLHLLVIDAEEILNLLVVEISCRRLHGGQRRVITQAGGAEDALRPLRECGYNDFVMFHK